MERKTLDNRKLVKALGILLSAFVVLGLACFFAGKALLSNIYRDRVDIVSAPDSAAPFSEQELLDSPELLEAALRTDIDYFENGEIDRVPIYEQKKIDRFIFSILVVVQQGKTENQNAQAQMLYVVSYNQLEYKFTVVAIPPETLVPLKGYGWNRIRAAYALGGIGMLMNTINDAFGLDIQDYVYIGTEELAALADGINGIPTELTEGEAAYLNQTLGCELSAGQQMLSGEQAVAYLMDDVSDGKGSLGRAKTQLKVVTDTFYYLQDSFTREYLYPFMVTIFQGIRTNLDFEILEDLGHEIVMAEDLQFHTLCLPYADSFWEHTLDGAYGILPMFEKNRILLMQDLYGVNE